MNDAKRKRIDEKVGYWDQLKTSLTTPDPTARDKALEDIATRNEEEERRRKAAEAQSRVGSGQGGQS